MTLTEARELLTAVRAGLVTSATAADIDEALHATGDLPAMTRREQLKAFLYEDGDMFEIDHAMRRIAKLTVQEPVLLTSEQMAAVDEMADVANERNPADGATK